MDVTPVTPITSFSVCRNVPLSADYRDTILFGNVSLQTQYFAGKAKYTWNDLTPVRMNNQVSIPVNAEMVYDCNYVMWTNANFGAKKFYGFITNVDYVNVNMCRLSIEMDVMQTWQFDMVWHKCFVEREHITSDTIGANIVDEGLDIGESVYEDVSDSGYLNEYRVCLATTIKPDGTPADGGFLGNTYMACHLGFYTSAANLQADLNALTNADKTEAIVGLFMCPSETISGSVSLPVVKPKKYTAFGSYIPHNSKLWCYPYNYLHVTDYAGKYVDFRYEDFSSANCQFTVYGTASQSPAFWLVPKNYRGLDEDWTSKLLLDNYPQCAYNIDTYKEWFAEKGLETAINIVGSVLGSNPISIGSRASGGVLETNAGFNPSGLLSVAGSLAGIASLQNEPPSNRGSSQSDALINYNKKNFWFMPCKIKEEYARIIDGFFDMYGYKTNEVKVPNRTGRPAWNYVKTNGCNITGNISFDDIKKIRSIVDRGITFWHTTDVGNYNLNNQVE